MALPFPPMIEFDSISPTQIGLKFINILDATIRWCREYGITETMKCSLCTKPCIQQNYLRAKGLVIRRCTVKRCKRTFSIRKVSLKDLIRNHRKL